MSRSLVAAAALRPGWAVGDLSAEGPDEDTFTLAVAALERLIAGSGALFAEGFDQLDLVGSFPSGIDAELPLAMGWAEPEIRHHSEGIEGFVQAARNASAGHGPRSSALVAVDTVGRNGGEARPWPAMAVSLGFGPDVGARLIGTASRRHPLDRRPEAAGWVAAARRATPRTGPEAKGVLGLMASAPPPVLLQEWARTFPSVRTELIRWTPPSTATSPSVAMALATHGALTAAAPGDTVWAACVRPERTDFLGFELEAPVQWHGTFAAPSDPPALRTVRFSEPTTSAVDAVSQGAYVPLPRYLENLPARWRFAAERCRECQTITFPPRGRCRNCDRVNSLEPTLLPRENLEVEAVTVVAPGAQPSEFDPLVAAVGPYAVVLVRLSEGVRATLQVTDADPSSVRVGDRLDTVLRRLYPMEGSWRYGRKAIPRTAGI